jgi:hypothetical protein
MTRPTPDIGEPTDEHRPRSDPPPSIHAVTKMAGAVLDQHAADVRAFLREYRAALPLAHSPRVVGSGGRGSGLGDPTGELATDRALERIRGKLAYAVVAWCDECDEEFVITHECRYSGNDPEPTSEELAALAEQEAYEEHREEHDDGLD